MAHGCLTAQAVDYQMATTTSMRRNVTEMNVKSSSCISNLRKIKGKRKKKENGKGKKSRFTHPNLRLPTSLVPPINQ